MARGRKWSDAYAPLVAEDRDRAGYSYTDEAYGIFPRYNVDYAVLDAVERFDPDALPDLETLRTSLVESARIGATDLLNPIGNAIELQAMADERKYLARTFAEIKPRELLDEPKLYYRRILTAIEVDNIRERLRVTWGITSDYWFPLGEKTHPSLEAFDLQEIGEADLQIRIRQFLSSNRIGRISELREYGPLTD